MSVLDPDQWKKIDRLLVGVLDQPASKQQAWLEEACGDDEELRAEVRRLLELAVNDWDSLAPDGAMDGPLWTDLAGEDGGRPVGPALKAGDRLGNYRIANLLGTGGMGEVYVGEDPKLSRRIAIKMLPSELDSRDRRMRFEREAKAIAALNHPNVVHVYSVEEFEGIHFMTMEWVRGKTLSALIPPGGFATKALLDISISLASALASAHDQGVIHRDLKPANVMINEDGLVKVLDFGLAKFRRPDFPEALSESVTQSATMEGHVVGTVSHMSPEQAEGKEVDPRTDIFSLGVTLYEMATGRQPFSGGTPAAILSAILKDTPEPASAVNPNVPDELTRIIKRCLAKDPARRYQNCADLRTDLEELRYDIESRKLFVGSADRNKRGAGATTWAFAVAATAVVVGAVAFTLGRGGADLPPGGETRFTQITTQPGREFFPTLSPDGSFVAYASRESGNWDIYLRRVGGQRAINLTEDSLRDDTQPIFSPDGEHIAFRSARNRGGIFIMGATGERVRLLSEFGWNPSFSPDGQRLVFATESISRDPFDRPTTSELWIVDVETTETELLYKGDAVQPSWSPKGDRIAYWGLSRPGAQRDLWTIATDPAKPDIQRLTSDAAVDWNPVWSPDGGALYFSSDRGGSMNLWRVPVDVRGAASAEPLPITTPSPFVSHLSVSGDGQRIAYASTVIYERLGEATFSLSELELSDVREYREVQSVSNPRPSPDGQFIAYGRTGLQEDIILMSLDGTESRELTSDEHRDRHPRWSPDGERLAFYSNRGGSYDIWSINKDGTELTPLTNITERNVWYPIFSPDGSRLMYTHAETSGVIVSLADESDAAELPAFSDDVSFVPVDWAPDGTRIVGYLQKDSGARAGIAVYSLDDGTYRILTPFGMSPTWFLDSRHVVFQSQSASLEELSHNYQQDAKLFVVDSQTGAYKELLAINGTSLETPTPSHDGTRLFFVETTVESDIWLLSYEEKS